MAMCRVRHSRQWFCALALLVAMTKEAAGQSTRCLSFTEARKLYPTTRIVYRVRDGVRCWYAPGRAIPRQELPPPPPPDQATWTIDAPRVSFAIYDPPLRHVPELPLYDPPRRRSVPEPDVIYSTFAGSEPEVWPLLPEPINWRTIGVSVFILVFYTIAFLFLTNIRQRKRWQPSL